MFTFKDPFPWINTRTHAVFNYYNSFYLLCKEWFSAFERGTKNKFSLKPVESHWKTVCLILPVLCIPLGLLLCSLKASPYWVQSEQGQSLSERENSLHRTACAVVLSSASELLLQSQHRLNKWICLHLASYMERYSKVWLVRGLVAHFVDCRIWSPKLLTLHWPGKPVFCRDTCEWDRNWEESGLRTCFLVFNILIYATDFESQG